MEFVWKALNRLTCRLSTAACSTRTRQTGTGVIYMYRYVSVAVMERNYIAIPKGSGFVYACDNKLYNRVKTKGNVKYLKCDSVGCDGSAKIVEDKFFLLVSA
jgi:hypothetical protein